MATAPALEIARAYQERWEIELVIDEVDTHQRPVGRPPRSLLPKGVMQELYGLLIAHYALRFLMHQAAKAANLDPDRLSFVHTIEVVQDAISDFQLAAPQHFDRLYQRLLYDIASVQLPARRFRRNPRVVKQKMSNFALKRPVNYRPYQRDGCVSTFHRTRRCTRSWPTWKSGKIGCSIRCISKRAGRLARAPWKLPTKW